MKRFTETTKWRDPWFRRLTAVAKLLWLYITDHCSCIGLVELDLEAVRFDIGQPVNEKHLTELGDRLQALGNGKFFVPKFIPFQYGQLSIACPAHKPILKAIEQHQLKPLSNGYQYPSDRVVIPFRNGMEKEKDQEKEKEGKNQSSIPGSTVIPDSLNTDEFKAAWVRWLEHLKQKRKPATIHAQDLQLLKLSEMGIPKAITTLNHCIEKNWQGIYEPTGTGHGTSQSRPNPRNEGIARSPATDYSAALKRKLAKQDADAARREVECQVAEPENGSPSVAPAP